MISHLLFTSAISRSVSSVADIIVNMRLERGHPNGYKTVLIEVLGVLEATINGVWNSVVFINDRGQAVFKAQ